MSNGKGLGWSTPSLGSFWQMLKKGANHAQHQFLTTTNQSLLKQCPPWSGKLLSSPKILETGTWLLIAPSMRTADVSPRSSPLRDVSRGGTFATQRQKFHIDDAKSVRNPVRSANWSTEKFHCFSYCLRMTDKRQKAAKVKCKRDESLTKQPIFVEYSLLSKKHLSFAGAHLKMNTTLYQNRPGET